MMTDLLCFVFPNGESDGVTSSRRSVKSIHLDNVNITHTFTTEAFTMPLCLLIICLGLKIWKKRRLTCCVAFKAASLS